MMGDRPRSLSILLAGLLAVETATVASALSPATGYESSWIDGMPLLAKIAVPIGAIVFALLLARREPALAVVIGAATILLVGLQPFLRGYAAYGRADPQTYMGDVLVIKNTGFVWRDDIYPLVHILIAQFSLVTGLEPRDTMFAWATLQYVAWIAIVGVWASRWLGPGPRTWLAMAIACIPVFTQFHFVLYPNGYGVLVLGMVLALWMDRLDRGFLLILFLLFLALPYAHPVVTILAVLLFVLLQLVPPVVRKLRLRIRVDVSPRAGLLLPYIGFISVATWLLNFRQVQLMISKTFAVTEVRNEGQASEVARLLFGTHPDVLRVLIAIVVLGGTIAALGTLGLAAWLASRRTSHTARAVEIRRIMVLSFVFFAVAMFGLLFSPGLGRGVVFVRAVGLPYILIVAPVAIASWSPPRWHRRVLPVALAAILLLAAVAVFRSPLTFQYNDQVTEQEYDMATWLLAHAPEDRLIARVHAEPWRLVDGSIGSDAQAAHPVTFALTQYVRGGIAPEHFALPSPLRDAVGKDRLVTVTSFDHDVYTGVWSGTGRWTADDFAGLTSAYGNSVVFSAGGTRVIST